MDRHGELLVNNVPGYELMVVPRAMAGVDTAALATLLSLEKDNLVARLNKARRYSRYKASPLLRQLNAEEYARSARNFGNTRGCPFGRSPCERMSLALQAKSWANTARSTAKT